MARSKNSYKNIKYRSFPREDSIKNEEWALSYVQSIYHRHLTGYASEYRYTPAFMDILHKYAVGEQGASSVKKKLLRKDKQSGEYFGKMRDVFQTYDILPKFINIIASTNMKADYRPTAIAIDGGSLEDKKKELSLAKFLVQEKTREFLSFMGVKVNSILSEEELAVYSDTDVEVMFKMGGVKLQREIEAIACCSDMMQVSGHKEIEDMNTLDFITYGITGVKVFRDYNEDNVKFRHVDVRNLIMPKSKYKDFRDANYAAEIIPMRLHDIVSQCENPTEDMITKLIENNMGSNHNFQSLAGDVPDYVAGNNSLFDDFIVMVLDAQWLANDIESRLQFATASGGYGYKNIPNDYKLTGRQIKNKSKISRYRFVKRYEALWPIGSDFLISFSLSKDNVYYGNKGRKTPKLDYCIYKTGGRSLVDKSRTIVDDINLNKIKLRSAIATIPPGPGLIIYEHALNNVKMGNKLQSGTDLVHGLVEMGVLVVNGRDSQGKYIASNGGKAVDKIPDFAIQQVAVFSNELISDIQRLRDVLGVPEGLDGTPGNPYTGVGQVNLAAISSSNALYPELSGIGPLYSSVYDKGVSKWQVIRKSRKVDLKTGDGAGSYNVLSLSDGFDNYDFRTTMRYSPTEDEKMFLINQINEMGIAYIQSAGSIGCSKAEFFMIYKLIKSGLLDEAMYEIARIEKMREENNLRIQKANQEDNIRSNNESIRLNKEAALEELEEENRQKRLNDANKSAEETKRDLSKEYLRSASSGEGPLVREIYNSLINEANADIASIEKQSTATAQQEVQQPEMS